MKQDTAVLLLNVGSPDSPGVKDVRRYLTQFLGDPRVINLPSIPRWLLVNLIIVPFRSSHSSRLYRQLWTADGAPLVLAAQAVSESLQAVAGDSAKVFFAMRYGKPSIVQVMREIKEGNYAELVVVPLFPQYASSSSGTAMAAVMEQLCRWTVIPSLRVINQFYRHPLFIKAFAERIRQYPLADFDHILFSYHGLPISHLEDMCTSGNCSACNCEQGRVGEEHCYKAACYDTTRLLAEELSLEPACYSVAFQSRLSRKWIGPFSDKLVEEKAKQGVKKLLVVAPAFVADCLETSVEIGVDYLRIFKQHGGEHLQLVESLNNSPNWIQALKAIIEGKID